jgi:hypothetical protein
MTRRIYRRDTGLIESHYVIQAIREIRGQRNLLKRLLDFVIGLADCRR